MTEGTTRTRSHQAKVRVDPDLCMGFRECLSLAPDLFEWDEQAFQSRAKEGVTEAAAREAINACPVSAIEVVDEDPVGGACSS